MNYILALKKTVKYISKYGFEGFKFINEFRLKEGTIYSISPRRYKHPIYLRSGLSDLKVFNQVILKKEYNINYELDPQVIIDCGANIGLSAIFYANKFPNATIISIEPEPTNYEMLKKNTEPYKNIKCLNYGIWSHSTNLEIIDNNYGNWAFMVVETTTETPNSIKAIAIYDILQQFNLDKIDILKIDIEGSEKEVFESNTEKWLSKVNVIVIELHDGMRKGCSKSFFKSIQDFTYKIKIHKESIICFLN